MPIYDKPTRVLMKEMVTEMPITPGQVVTKEAVFNWFATHYPKIKESTLAAHLIRLSTNAPSRLQYSAKPGEDDVFFKLDSSRFRLYDPATDPVPITDTTGLTQPTPPEKQNGEPGEPNATEFAYERDLRNFLSKNLSVLEPGLKLYEAEGIAVGVEFDAGGRFIDILGLDSSGAYVVIELKVSRGHERTVGQLRRYMGWIAKHQADPGQAVRGIIVAREISQDLILASYGLKDVELFEYEMSVSVKKIEG
jgi:endonuclease